MTLDAPAAQLQAELDSTLVGNSVSPRPVLHHLNADSSWLLQVPRPNDDGDEIGRAYFNILIDPWLSGSQTDYVSWFSRQWHLAESAVPTIPAAEELLSKSEHNSEFSRDKQLQKGPHSGSLIDAVVISHEFSDHCHKDTLLQVHRSVPVFATTAAAKLISSWSHFDSVNTVPAFTKDWQREPIADLPSYISIARLTTPRDVGKLHSAVLLAFDSGSGPECVIYTPHGIVPTALEAVTMASPPLKTLALIHGLHDIKLAIQQLNLGAENGVLAQRTLGARYWIGTHDEVKHASGLVSWLLGRRAWKAEDVLDDTVQGEAEWSELGNGESKVLI